MCLPRSAPGVLDLAPGIKMEGCRQVALLAVLGASMCLGAVAADVPDSPPLAVLSAGQLRGRWMQARGGRPYAAFQSIPFAAPPVGDLRFKEPQPAPHWDSELDATKLTPSCSQRDTLVDPNAEVSGQEDCLYLNVFTPTTETSLQDGKVRKPPMDVLVYIHGGGWFCGSSAMYEADYFLEHDVVLVTINYRLGPLGFLSTEDDVLPGNNGLKDQVAALRWVRDNIAAFGGNPDSVTIFGESAGGASVHMLVLSPLAKGLFHRAVALSGTAMGLWAVAPPGEAGRNAKRLAEALGCPTAPSKALRDCLLAKPHADITGTDQLFVEWYAFPVIPFKPVVEHSSVPRPFLTQRPRDAITSGSVNDVPFITGVTSHEGCLFAWGMMKNDTLRKEFDERFDTLVPIMTLTRNYPRPVWEELVHRVREFYFGSGPISKEAVESTINLISDSMFWWPAVQTIELHSQLKKSPVYFYKFSHSSQRSFSLLFGSEGDVLGTCHCDDLIHLFPLTGVFPNMRPSPNDDDVSQTFVKMFVNFAKTGKPTADDSWRQVNHPAPKESEYLHIGSPDGAGVSMQSGLAPDRIELWNSLPVQTEAGRGNEAHEEL